jgi:tryptophan-rich sensory protein
MAEANERSEWWKTALITVPAIVVGGALSGFLSGSGNGNPWFDGLAKPFFIPPGWVFGVVWPILYAILGVALALVLAEPSTPRRKSALILFFAQLALNFAWSPVFFAAHAIQPALVIIVVMVGLAALAASQFRQIRLLAGLLMLPYLLWLCFAAALTSAIGTLNPTA